jgi:ParB-like chromosome segregation protein Spo0J
MIISDPSQKDVKEVNRYSTAKVSDLVLKYENLVFKLNPPEYKLLKTSIEENGVKIPVEINLKNEILDGNHRTKICKEIGLESIPVRVSSFENELEEKKFAIKMNLERRHLIDFLKAELFTELDKVETEIAKQRQKKLAGTRPNTSVSPDTKVKDNPSTKTETGRTRDKIAELSGLSPATYARAKKIIERADEATKIKLRTNKIKIGQAYNYYQKQDKRAALRAESAASIDISPDRLDLVLGDFREKCKKIPDNSIGLIYTDPPYSKEFIPLYKDLGEVAFRVLKEGGSLVTNLGQLYLKETYEHIESSGLRYNWILAIMHTGAADTQHGPQVHVTWKPLLWFVKGPKLRTPDYINDSIKSLPPDKSLQDWAQSPVEAEHVISKLTVEGDTVLDCFMGSGTTGIAALNLKRRFIGMEIDENRFNVAKVRVVKEVERLKNNNDTATTAV